ncbi:TonB-dependent receptor [Gaoshiqia sp. Z1-71]|uniref:TonB-dependent receptor n=1 Tax=Gaoshiqia hydrogeniformans TaxID=3290090 RepID=UPI003BF8A71E
MRTTLFVLLVTISQVFATSTYSQNTRLNMNLRNVSIREVLMEIENNSDFYFMYDATKVDVSQRVDVSGENLLVTEILDKIFQETGIIYEVNNRQIALTSTQAARPVSQDARGLSGRVTDSSGTPLPGVTVVVKGTTMGTITDIDGRYSLDNVPANATVIFSFVGMTTQEIAVSGKTTINVSLAEEMVGIEEVVAIGYGTMRKSDLSGSIASVKAEDLTAFPTTQAMQALQGRASGVHVQATNGEPGSDYRVRIRGAKSISSSSDPLIVVDGFPGVAMPVSEDIQSVEVLKDASATAIYGSRGANGVIMVTTKSGKAGKARIELNSSYSAQKVLNKLDLLKTADYINYVNEIEPGKLSGTGYEDTDWQDETFRQGGIQNYQLSISGGNDDVRYYVSGVVYDQKGIVLDSKFKRYSITSNLDLQASKNLKVGVKLFASRELRDGTVSMEGSGGAGQTGVMSATVLTEPTIPVYNEDGTYHSSFMTGLERDNPVAIAKETAIESESDNLQANVFGEYQLTKNLKFRSTFGAQTWSNRYGNYLPSTMHGGRSLAGRGFMEGRRITNLSNENYFTFSEKFNDVHDLTVMAGYTYESYRSEYWRGSSQNYITDAFGYWNLSGGSVYNAPLSSLTESELASFYGRLHYKLFDRYLVTFTGRYDGSSKFAKNNKWGFFPSGAVAWNLAEEGFMDGVPQISQLKLRGSYGVTGNQSIPAYGSLALMNVVRGVILGNQVVNAVTPNTVANDNLTWEKTAQTDIGIDLGLFDQRISLVADYYYMKTTDQLFQVPLVSYSGYNNMWKNFGSVENKGFEFSLTTVNLNGDFKWTTDLNFSRNRNKVLKLPGGSDIRRSVFPGHMVGIDNTNILREGQPMGAFYGYIYDGVYQEGDTFLPGDGFEQVAGGEKFRDINGKVDDVLTGQPDGQLNADDRTIIGDPNPDFIWGLNNTFEYKGFDLNIFVQASQGNDIYSFTLFELELMQGFNNSTTRALDRWTPTHTNTDVPKATASRSRISSSRFVYDGSYIRLKNISLGYQLPKSLLRGAGISYARVYVSGQNLVTITDYPGYDPEVNYLGATGMGTTSNVIVGYDYGSYPSAKSVTVGVQVKF